MRQQDAECRAVAWNRLHLNLAVVQLDRAHNRHFAFGAGIHRCLGSNLARMELRVALEAFLDRIPTFTIDDAEDPHWSGGQVRGPRRVMLRW